MGARVTAALCAVFPFERPPAWLADVRKRPIADIACLAQNCTEGERPISTFFMRLSLLVAFSRCECALRGEAAVRAELKIVAVTVLLAGTPGLARERLLSPTDEWRTELHAENCSFSRNFIDGQGDAIRFSLEAFGTGDSLRLILVGEGLPLRDLRRGVARFRYRFKPDTGWRDGYGTTGYVNGVDALTFQIDLASSEEIQRRNRAAARHRRKNT